MKITYLIKNLHNVDINPDFNSFFSCSTKQVSNPNNIVLNNGNLADFYNMSIEKSYNYTDYYYFINAEDLLIRNPEQDAHHIKNETQGIFWDYLAGEGCVFEEPYSRIRLTEIYWFPRCFMISSSSAMKFDRASSPAEEYEFLLRFTDKYMIKHIPYFAAYSTKIYEDKNKAEKWKKAISCRL